jgi:hypothetical protein
MDQAEAFFVNTVSRLLAEKQLTQTDLPPRSA